jgi:LysM repeat protein
MKTRLLLLGSFFILNSTYAACQLSQQHVEQEAPEQVTLHRVALGETVVLIAKKYRVTPKDIYELNAAAVDGLSAGMSLRIPVGRKVKDEVEVIDKGYQVVAMEALRKPKQAAQKPASETPVTTAAAAETTPLLQSDTAPEAATHKVKAGETLSELAEKYNTTIKAITAANAGKLKRGLQSGQVLTIPSSSGTITQAEYDVASAQAVTAAHEPETEHKVIPGETLTSLARKYNTTISAITEANASKLRKGLQAGQVLIIPASVEAEKVESSKPEPEGQPLAADEAAEHKVQPGETLTFLAKKYNTTIDAIMEANSKKLRRGLQAGQIITIKQGADVK